MINSDYFLRNVQATLRKLNQCRLVEIDKKDLKSKYLNSWPLYYDNKNTEVINHLKAMGIYPKKDPYVKVFEVDYDTYNKSKKIDGGNSLILKSTFLRNYIEVRRLELQDCNEMEISIVYDPDLTNEIDLPLNTSDYQAIQKIAKHTDILFAFNLPSHITKAKGLPPFFTKVKGYTGMFILNEMNLFQNIKIKHVHDRLKSSKVKKDNRAIRVITDDLESFEKVVNLTEENIKKSIKLEAWTNDLEKITMTHELDN